MPFFTANPERGRTWPSKPSGIEIAIPVGICIALRIVTGIVIPIPAQIGIAIGIAIVIVIVIVIAIVIVASVVFVHDVSVWVGFVEIVLVQTVLVETGGSYTFASTS